MLCLSFHDKHDVVEMNTIEYSRIYEHVCGNV